MILGKYEGPFISEETTEYVHTSQLGRCISAIVVYYGRLRFSVQFQRLLPYPNVLVGGVPQNYNSKFGPSEARNYFQVPMSETFAL